LDHHALTALPGGQQLPLLARTAPAPGQVAGAVAGYLVLREFRARLYRYLTARPDGLFELTDAILCTDHAVTSRVQQSLVPQFRRRHGALYDALDAGRIDDEALATLLTQTLPQLIDGEDGTAWAAERDTIDYEASDPDRGWDDKSRNRGQGYLVVICAAEAGAAITAARRPRPRPV
jgi:hypothetical protein